MKVAVKQLIWSMPAPLGRAMVEGLCAARLLEPSYRAYFKIRRPKRVLSGPFAGMKYEPIAVGGCWMAKVLGCYERELHPAIERLRHDPCDLLVDIGSAEGYYAVGLTLVLDPARTICYDIDPRAHPLMRRLAALNGVGGRMVTGGYCTPEELDRALAGAGHPVVVCDIEGAETDLLRPDLAPQLRRTRLLVEVHDRPHDHKRPLVSAQLRERFAPSHDIEEIPAAGRGRESFPPDAAPGVTLTDAEVRASVSESRNPGTHWFVLHPKAG